MIVSSRRTFITGLVSLVAAPAIVRVESLMPVRAPKIIRPEKWIIESNPSLVIYPWQREILTAMGVDVEQAGYVLVTANRIHTHG